jgi:hypothetical protein
MDEPGVLTRTCTDEGAMRSRALVVALVVFAAPCGAQLQELQAGARVRIWAPSVLGGRTEGFIGARRADTLSVLPTTTSPVDVPISALTRVDLYRGKSRSAGALRGLIWGAAIAAPFAVIAALGDNGDWNTVDPSCDSDLDQCDMYSDASLVASTVGGGALIGAAIGAIVGRARWERLQVPVRSSIVVPSRGRVGVAFAVGR